MTAPVIEGGSGAWAGAARGRKRRVGVLVIERGGAP